MEVDLIVRNGIVVTASDIWPMCDIAIKVPSIPEVDKYALIITGRNYNCTWVELACQRWHRSSGR